MNLLADARSARADLAILNATARRSTAEARVRVRGAENIRVRGKARVTENRVLAAQDAVLVGRRLERGTDLWESRSTFARHGAAVGVGRADVRAITVRNAIEAYRRPPHERGSVR